MSILNFSEEEKNETLRIVAGVLHFGNIKFAAEKRANEEDAAMISNADVVDCAAQLWGLDTELVSKSILSRNIGTRSIVLVRYNVAQAQVDNTHL